jgi:hypothetical protein
MLSTSSSLFLNINCRLQHILFLLVVGKTCLIVRYASNEFTTTTILTCGFDSKTKYIEMDGATIKLQVCAAQTLLC